MTPVKPEGIVEHLVIWSLVGCPRWEAELNALPVVALAISDPLNVHKWTGEQCADVILWSKGPADATPPPEPLSTWLRHTPGRGGSKQSERPA